MKTMFHRITQKLAVVSILATTGVALAVGAPAFASTKTLSDYVCSQGSFQNGSHYIIGMTYDCLATASSTSGQAITISNRNNGAGVTAATWSANLSSIGMTIAFVNNGTTAPQIHVTGTPTATVASGSNYSPAFDISDGQTPNYSVDQSFRAELKSGITATIAGTSGSTSLASNPVVASGTAITLTSTVAALPTGYTLSYQWQKDGTNISGATGASYTIASATSSSSYTLNAVVSWTDGVHTVTDATPSWLGSYSVNVSNVPSGSNGVVRTTTTTLAPSSTSPVTSFDESNTSNTTVSDSASISGIVGTATFSDGSQLVVAKSGAVTPRLFTAFKGLASGTLKATYKSGTKTVSFSCKYANFGSIKASPSATKSVNNWFPKSFISAKKACVLPKAAMTSAASSTVKVVVKLTFNRLWPTTAKALNPDSKAVIHAAHRTMTLTFGKTS